MKEKTILKELKNRGWNMQFDAREKHLIKEIAEIIEAKYSVEHLQRALLEPFWGKCDDKTINDFNLLDEVYVLVYDDPKYDDGENSVRHVARNIKQFLSK